MMKHFFWREQETQKILGRSNSESFAREAAELLASKPNGNKPARTMEVVVDDEVIAVYEAKN